MEGLLHRDGFPAVENAETKTRPRFPCRGGRHGRPDRVPTRGGARWFLCRRGAHRASVCHPGARYLDDRFGRRAACPHAAGTGCMDHRPCESRTRFRTVRSEGASDAAVRHGRPYRPPLRTHSRFPCRGGLYIRPDQVPIHGGVRCFPPALTVKNLSGRLKILPGRRKDLFHTLKTRPR